MTEEHVQFLLDFISTFIIVIVIVVLALNLFNHIEANYLLHCTSKFIP